MSNGSLAIIREFLKAIEARGDATAYFADDAVHIQLPNAISLGPPRSLWGIPYRLIHPAGIVKVTSAGVAPPAAVHLS